MIEESRGIPALVGRLEYLPRGDNDVRDFFTQGSKTKNKLFKK